MFKKTFKVSKHNELSKKDTKKLKQQLEKDFDPVSIENLFANCKKVFKAQLAGTKTQIFFADEIPIFFDTDGRNNVFPTLYTLNEYPRFSKALHIHEAVQRYVLNGADLMWPGVSDQLNNLDFKRGEKFAVRVIQSGLFVAVGTMASNRGEVTTKTGRALQSIHFCNDSLWLMGNKKFSNPHLTEQVVAHHKTEEVVEDSGPVEEFPTLGATITTEEHKVTDKVATEQAKEGGEETKADSDEVDPVQVAENEEGKREDSGFQGDCFLQQFIQKDTPVGEKADKDNTDGQSQSGDSENEETKDQEAEEEEEEVKGEENEENTEAIAVDEDEEEEEDTMTVEERDHLLYESFLSCLKLSIKREDLPVEAGFFYASHIIPCRPVNIALDIKKSSYKKVGKFLQAMSKKGIINYHEASKKAPSQITGINFEHEEVKSFSPSLKKPRKVGGSSGTSANTGGESGNGSYKTFGRGKNDPMVEISELYKPINKIKEFFDYVGLQTGKETYYKKTHVRDMLVEYLKERNLITKGGSCKLDEHLAMIISEKKVGNTYAQGDTIKVAALNDVVLSRMRVVTVVENFKDGTETVIKGKFQGVSLTIERVMNKKVTKIKGLETFGLVHKKITSQFQQKFSCSVTIDETLGAGNHFIILQGDHSTTVPTYLTTSLGINRKYISIENKLPAKKKK